MFSCSKESMLEIEDCLDQKLIEYKMTSYNGEDLGCKFFLEKYEYKNKYYYSLNNNCTDMITQYFDCNGVEVFSNDNNILFYQESIYLGIVGIK